MALSANATFPSKNVGEYRNIRLSIKLTGDAAQYYELSQSTVTASGSITSKAVTVTGLTAADKVYDGTTAATIDCTNAVINGKIDGDDLSVVSAVGAFASKDVAEGNHVSLSSVTLSGADKDNYTLSVDSNASISAQILRRPVTLKSSSFSKPYDGQPLTNGTGGVTVSVGSMVAGEAFDYSFSATQTAVGSCGNAFTALSSATANTANYSITYDYGTLAVTVPTYVGENVDNLTPNTVTPSDRNEVESALKEVNDYLAMSPTEEEKAELNKKKEQYEKLLARIDEIDRNNAASTQKPTFFGIATGDESNLTLWAWVTVLSLCTAVGAAVALKKKRT